MTGSYGFRVYAKPPLDKVYKAAVKANRQIQVNKRDALRRLGRHFVDLAGEEAPGGQSGTIGRGIFFRTYASGPAAELRVYPGKIGGYHLYGTGIYGRYKQVIRPLKAKALRFEIAGKVVFAAWVRGIRPNPFFSRAYRRWLPTARSELREVARTWIREIASAKTQEKEITT